MEIDRLEDIENRLLQAEKMGLIRERYRSRYTQFINDIKRRDRRLSPKQEVYLSSIDDKCSQERISEAQRWMEEYSDDLREVAVICAEYYSRTNYYRDLRGKVLADPKGHVLTKGQFDAMCGNKYAVSAFREWTADPKFQDGQLVEIRRTNRLDLCEEQKISAYGIHMRAMAGEKINAIILKSNALPVYRMGEGTKVYRILPFGFDKPIYACEKDLKKARA